jgi:hypothetical protein
MSPNQPQNPESVVVYIQHNKVNYQLFKTILLTNSLIIYEQNNKDLSAGETYFEKVVKSPNNIERNISIDIKSSIVI